MSEVPICGTEAEGERCFWPLPARPKHHEGIVEKTLIYYTRTNPKTGEVSDLTTYPNNMTPRRLQPFLKMLQTLTVESRKFILKKKAQAEFDYNVNPFYTFVSSKDYWEQVWNWQQDWQERLTFYIDFVYRMMKKSPDAMVGDGDDPDAVELATFVTDPLFYGWYPNDVEPFKDQPPPYSSQTEQAGMDLMSTFSIANIAGVLEKSVNDSFVRFKKDLEDATGDIIDTINMALVAGLIGLGIYAGFTTGLLTRKR